MQIKENIAIDIRRSELFPVFLSKFPHSKKIITAIPMLLSEPDSIELTPIF